MKTAINPDKIEKIFLVNKSISEWYIKSIPERIKFFSRKIIPASIEITTGYNWESVYFSKEEFLKSYNGYTFLIDSDVIYEKPYIHFQFTKSYERMYFDTNEEAEKKYNEIVKTYNLFSI